MKERGREPRPDRPAYSRKTLRLLLIAGGAAFVAAVWAITVMHPLPPHAITLACGPEGSSYEVFGKRYKKLLAKQGIELHLVATAGGVDNLSRLHDPRSGVQAGFVIGGATEESESEDLLSLGTVTYEPVWLFTRNFTAERGLFSLRGKRVSVGPEGSDSRALVVQILKRNKLDLKAFHALALSPEASQSALIEGTIDAVVLVNSWASPVVRKLVNTEGIHLASFTRADAYAAIFPSLSKVVIPAGVANLEKDIPHQETVLLATKSSLIVRGDMHPGLQFMLLETISQVHSRHGIFQKAGEFPAPDALEIPLSPDARHYYKSGKPFLQRFLPFWLAALLEQIVILLLPLIGLMYPLIKGGRSLYGWGMQRRIFLIYGELHWLEGELDKLGALPPTPELLARMKHLEERTNRVKVPAAYLPMLFELKSTLGYVRSRLNARGGA